MPKVLGLGDRPVEPTAGMSGTRERLWGLVGGFVGAVTAGGSFLVAWLIDHATLHELSGAPYPPFLATRGMIALDYYFLGVLSVGLAFLVGALASVRRGRFPRSDGLDAILIGMLLSALGGLVLFVRLFALTHE
jgi:hypothetical protein